MCVDLRPDSVSEVYRSVLQHDAADPVRRRSPLPDSAGTLRHLKPDTRGLSRDLRYKVHHGKKTHSLSAPRSRH
jgi:hypothetical protein